MSTKIGYLEKKVSKIKKRTLFSSKFVCIKSNDKVRSLNEIEEIKEVNKRITALEYQIQKRETKINEIQTHKKKLLNFMDNARN